VEELAGQSVVVNVTMTVVFPLTEVDVPVEVMVLEVLVEEVVKVVVGGQDVTGVLVEEATEVLEEVDVEVDVEVD
jgi:hypothetical protein